MTEHATKTTPRKSDTVHGLVGHVPARWEFWNRAMRGAYLKGAKAAHKQAPISACPYDDHRKPSGRLSWSRAFIRCWQEGHEAASAFLSANVEVQGRAEAGEARCSESPGT